MGRKECDGGVEGVVLARAAVLCSVAREVEGVGEAVCKGGVRGENVSERCGHAEKVGGLLMC